MIYKTEFINEKGEKCTHWIEPRQVVVYRGQKVFLDHHLSPLTINRFLTSDNNDIIEQSFIGYVFKSSNLTRIYLESPHHAR